VESQYTFTYSGAWLSLNAVYSTHRWLRIKEKNIWKEKFSIILADVEIPALEAFKLHIRYNSRMDCDNLTGGSKILVDTMRAVGIIAEDNKHIYRGISIEPDLNLRHNTYVVTIIPLQSLPKPPTTVKKTVKSEQISKKTKKE